MSDSVRTLRSHAQLLAHLTGAEGVAVYLPPIAGGGPRLLVHHGGPPPPELATLAAAADLAERAERDSPAAATSLAGIEGLALFPSADPSARLVRVAWTSAHPLAAEGAAAPERRGEEAVPEGGALWVGLRMATDPAAPADPGSGGPAPWGEAWTHRLAGALASLAAGLGAAPQSRPLADVLTALPARAELLTELEAALGSGRSAGRPLALLLVNPDDFGAVNERFDRRVGDAVLREVATRLCASVRRGDYVARYGGAIFAILLRATRRDAANRLATDLLRRLTEESYHRGALRLGFSVGVAVANPGQESQLDWQALTERADQALSAAKRDGGSCVRAWIRGSDVERAAHLDRLHAIFTGRIAKDYRHMMLLWESIGIVVGSADPRELARRIAHCLAENFRARRVGVFQLSADGRPGLLHGVARTAGGSGEFSASDHDRDAAARACRELRPVRQEAENPADPSGRVSWSLPLAIEGESLGALVLEGRRDNLDLDASDLRFLGAFASQMAMALDRARLAEQEKRRQGEERRQLESQLEELREALQASRLVYASAEMGALIAVARKVAPTDATVLITGESGTGKEVVARTLHALSSRRERPLVVVDCSAISPTLIDSELFGHERGAFTGAHTRAPGRLAEAHGGTLFLDEVAELPLDVQGKLLRFVQDKEFTPVGSSRPRTVEVRIIAATNVVLEARLAEGRFREDLYHRLNVVHLRVPPLRERREDILLLARLFVKQAAALYGKESLALSAAAEAALQAYAWPGNVRELQNRITQAVLLGEGPEIRAEDLGGLARVEPASASASPRAGGPEPATGDQRLSAIGERLRAALGSAVDEALRVGGDLPPVGRWVAHDLLRAADQLAGGVGRRAAQTLGIPETTFRRRQRDSAAGAPRPASWGEVLEALRQAVLHGDAGGSPGTDLHRWAESCLLDEILARAPEESAAAALLGVSQPTLVRRAVKYRLSRSRSLSEKPAQATPLSNNRRAENAKPIRPGRGLYRNT